jgi:hypothetical protein
MSNNKILFPFFHFFVAEEAASSAQDLGGKLKVIQLSLIADEESQI